MLRSLNDISCIMTGAVGQQERKRYNRRVMLIEPMIEQKSIDDLTFERLKGAQRLTELEILSVERERREKQKQKALNI